MVFARKKGRKKLFFAYDLTKVFAPYVNDKSWFICSFNDGTSILGDPFRFHQIYRAGFWLICDLSTIENTQKREKLTRNILEIHENGGTNVGLTVFNRKIFDRGKQFISNMTNLPICNSFTVQEIWENGVKNVKKFFPLDGLDGNSLGSTPKYNISLYIMVSGISEKRKTKIFYSMVESIVSHFMMGINHFYIYDLLPWNLWGKMEKERKNFILDILRFADKIVRKRMEIRGNESLITRIPWTHVNYDNFGSWHWQAAAVNRSVQKKQPPKKRMQSVTQCIALSTVLDMKLSSSPAQIPMKLLPLCTLQNIIFGKS